MGPLAAVERFLERLFERQSARLFRTAIRPVQVQRRLERSMVKIVTSPCFLRFNIGATFCFYLLPNVQVPRSIPAACSCRE